MSDWRMSYWYVWWEGRHEWLISHDELEGNLLCTLVHQLDDEHFSQNIYSLKRNCDFQTAGHTHHHSLSFIHLLSSVIHSKCNDSTNRKVKVCRKMAEARRKTPSEETSHNMNRARIIPVLFSGCHSLSEMYGYISTSYVTLDGIGNEV
jgi:hypothetical protein